MKIILSPNPYRDKQMAVVREAEKVLKECGVKTVVCLPFPMGDNFKYPKEFEWRDIHKEAAGTDMLICFGGDGTILHLARYARTHNIPILGVNTGSLGYMAELEPGEVKLLRRIVKGNYRLEPHMMLDFKVHRGKRVVLEDTALNEAVIKTSSVGQEIHFRVFADGGRAIYLLGRRCDYRHTDWFHSVQCLGRRAHRGAHCRKPADHSHLRP